ncbi:hypothetical protein ACX0AN_002749 [Acinetobacter baumannii]|uniref:hypothetical protein n=1 Tax=Acinetobacter baumannii TaxID=470 RepID=UPI0002B96B62|nr:hypothetical protein [Acinetobacter baumannii]EXA91354.1 putative membrane protein [Acinetobacter baumannii 1267820]EHU3242254.1 hypothetical protein [Acinetobacter baumannii]EJB8462017.1 hypothetical protein [Acinetobacter baumannii]EJB8477690.1 hypothetical protein [Acinetobacter baumannii]EJB8551370.1 hypothetical protein [Acinetobacter baumannii]
MESKQIITIAVLVLVLLILIFLFFLDISKENKDLINILLGTVVGWTGAIVNSYFGHDRTNVEPNDT